jgi:hypothetical protein
MSGHHTNNPSQLTNGLLDAEAVQLRLSKPTPHLRLVDLVCIIKSAIDRYNMLHKDIDGQSVLFVFLVDSQRFLVELMLYSNLRNLAGVVILQLVDIIDHLSFVSPDRRQKQEILEVFVVTERRRLDNNLLQYFN